MRIAISAAIGMPHPLLALAAAVEAGEDECRRTTRLGYLADLPEGKQIVGSWEVVVPDTFQPIDWFEDRT